MPKQHHVTRELLRSIARGLIPPEILVDVVRQHLAEVCPTCREEIESFSGERHDLSDYQGVVPTGERLDALLARAGTEGADVGALADELAALPPETRRLAVAADPGRFASPAAVDALLEECRTCLPADPEGAESWAWAAEEALLAQEPTDPVRAARAVAYRANARRARGDLREAERLFDGVQRLVLRKRLEDPELEAELASLVGSLYTDLRRFGDAVESLTKAVRTYRELGYDEELARTFMKLGNLHTACGDIEAAVAADRAAVEHIDREANPKLYLYGRFNLAHALAESGDPIAAQDLLAFDEDLYLELSDPLTQLRVRWLRGRLTAETVDPEEGERELLAVRDAFAAEGHGFNAAMVCLDLGLLYQEQGRLRDLREAASQAVQIFQAHEIHREALMALILVRDAVTSERATAETIRRAATFLRQAQNDPAARFQRPS